MLKHFYFIPFILIAIFSSGCSVFMAASSQDAPDLSDIGTGSSIAAVREKLGRPISSTPASYGKVEVYQFFSGDKANYGRAATYAVLDGVTLGLAEFVSFPVEALQGNKHLVRIRYDRHGKVIDMFISDYEPPLESPEKILGIVEEEQVISPDVKPKNEFPDTLYIQTKG